MTKWTVSLAAGLALALVAVASAHWAGHDGGAHGRIRSWMHGGPDHGVSIDAHLDHVAAKLELSAMQRKQVAGVLVAARPDLEARALALAEAHADQFTQVHATELDESALRAASERAGAAQAELAIAVARLLRDVRRVLTPEQLGRLSELHAPRLLDHVSAHVAGVGRGLQTWADRQ